VTTGASGAGNGAVTLTVDPNSGASRSGIVTIAGQTVTITQAETPRPCAYTVAPTTVASTAAGGTATVTVTTDTSCNWTAASQADWITVTSGATGAGNGTVTLTVAANGGVARSGSVLIASQSVTINQAGPPPPCTYAINPTEAAVAAEGGTTTVAVGTQASCAWSAVSNAGWITVSTNPTGNGNGSVDLAVAANSVTTPRSGTVTIAGHTFTVTQAAPPTACTYEVMPAHQAVSNAGGDFTVQITTQPGCGWTATPDATWVEIVGSATGAGAATLTYRVHANPGGPRTAKINIGAHRVSISQGPM
jgi:hypothetical protein